MKPLQASLACTPVLRQIVLEPFSNDEIEDNPNPVGQLYCTGSCLICCAHAISEGGKLVPRAQAVQWLLSAHADTSIGFGPQSLPVRHYLETAAGLGIEMRACSQAMHALGLGREGLVPQCAGLGGMVAFLGRGQDPVWRTLVF